MQTIKCLTKSPIEFEFESETLEHWKGEGACKLSWMWCSSIIHIAYLNPTTFKHIDHLFLVLDCMIYINATIIVQLKYISLLQTSHFSIFFCFVCLCLLRYLSHTKYTTSVVYLGCKPNAVLLLHLFNIKQKIE